VKYGFCAFDAHVGGEVGTMAFAEGTNGTFIITADENISARDAKGGGDSNGELNCDSFQPSDVMPDQVTSSVVGDPCLPESIPAQTDTCAGGRIDPDIVVPCGGPWGEEMGRMVMLKEVEPPSEVRSD